MSSFAQLSSSIDHYELYLSNKATEDELGEDDPSSASDWKAIFEPSIDVANLLYGKSDIAQAKVKQISISSLPLCYSETESIKAFVTIPPSFGACNQFFNTENVETFNNTPYVIPLEDVITSSAVEAVNIIDEKLGLPLIHFLVRSTLRIILDIQIFNANAFHKLTPTDIRLILAYLDASLLSRNIIHDYLCTKAGVTDDIKTHVQGNFTNARFPSKDTEATWIGKSTTILPPEERVGPLYLENAMNLDHFYEVNLKHAYDQEDGVSNRIKTETARWLQDMLMARDDDSEDKKLEYLVSLIESNKQLIALAIKTKEVLGVLEKHVKLNTVVKSQDELLKLSLNPNTKKLKVTFNPKQFLIDNNVSFTIKLPDHCSHILGADGEFSTCSITLGPFSHQSLKTKPATNMSNHIQHPHQSLAFPVRPVPRIILLVSNLCATLKRDHWLRDTPWSDYQILANIIVDESCIDSQLIYTCNTDEDYHRLNNSKTLLSQFRLCLLDGHFHKILFQKKTYMSLQLNLSPYNSPY